MEVKPTLVWVRRDLRLADHPALHAAAARGGAVIPLYVWAPEEDGIWSAGSAAKWWLNRSLSSFDSSLQLLNSKLIVRRGPTLAALGSLAEETGADSVFWQRSYEPKSRELEQKIQQTLTDIGFVTKTFDSSGLFDIHAIMKDDGSPYKVFTAFWRKLQSLGHPQLPLPSPDNLQPPLVWPASIDVEELRLLDSEQSMALFSKKWEPGEQGAVSVLNKFIDHGLDYYSKQKDRPGRTGTSMLSPHLSFGEISPRMLWKSISEREQSEKDFGKFLSELGWKEFARHIMYHFPDTPIEPLHQEFRRFPWQSNQAHLKAWQSGRTGYPIVDAGMRQLLSIGWLHNRVRMVVASFLIKDLILPWQEGSRWFWEKLVDADLANNTMGWQWAAGSGASANPFFRIFNPTKQGERFDPDGSYVRKWVPELSGLPNEWVHKPWLAPKDVLKDAQIRLGLDYPEPIVDHAVSRHEALSLYRSVKSGSRHVG